MTISSTVRKAGPFDGTGSQTEFPFEFKVFSAEDLYVVQYNEVLSVETVLELDSDYTVTLNADQDNDPGGTIELTSALAVDYTLTITSSLANLQPTDLTNRGGFYPSVINDALDRACIQIQQLQDETDRTLKTAVSVPDGVDNTLPMPAANMVIGWDNTGVALKNWSVNDLVTSVAYGSAKADVFTGDGETVDFYLELDPANINNLDVSVGGVCQVPGDDYTWISGTKVTFTVAPPEGETVLIRYMQALPQGTVDAPNVAYTASGTGAVRRTGQDKFAEAVSVKDFGAVGDGVTDDTAAIQAALAASSVIYFPTGNYLFTPPIVINDKNGVSIKGDGYNNTILTCKSGVSENAIEVAQAVTIGDGMDELTLRNFSLVGNSSAGHGVVLGGPTADDQITRVLIDNVHIHGFTKTDSAGIKLHNCWYSQISRSIIAYNYDGILLDGSGSSPFVSTFSIDGWTTIASHTRNGIRAVNGTNNVDAINLNEVSLEGNGAEAIYVGDTSSAKVICDNCYFEVNAATTESATITIIGNSTLYKQAHFNAYNCQFHGTDNGYTLDLDYAFVEINNSNGLWSNTYSGGAVRTTGNTVLNLYNTNMNSAGDPFEYVSSLLGYVTVTDKKPSLGYYCYYNSKAFTPLDTHIASRQTTAPTITVHAAAGTGTTAAFDSTATDNKGIITITTAGTPSTGKYFTVTFNKSYNNAPVVILGNTGSLYVATYGIYPANISATKFDVYVGSAIPTGGTASFAYFVIG